MSRPSSRTSNRRPSSSAGTVDGLLDKLQDATETFALDREIRLEGFRAQMEKLLVEQQRSFEQNSEARLSVRGTPPGSVETTYMFDSQQRSRTVTEGFDMFDADSTDVEHMVCGAESDAFLHARISTMPDLVRIDTAKFNAQNLYLEHTNSSTDVLLNSFSGTQAAWEEFVTPSEEFVTKRRLKLDRLEKVIHHQIFALVISLFILSKGVHIGFAASHNIQVMVHHYNHLEEKAGFKMEPLAWQAPVDLFFISVFTVEFVLRILEEELVFFFGVTGSGTAWTSCSWHRPLWT